MATRKMCTLLLIAVFSLFLTTGVQAGIINQVLGGDVDQGTGGIDIEVNIGGGESGNATLILNGTWNNQTQVTGSILDGSVMLGENTLINQTHNDYSVLQGPTWRSDTVLEADNDGTGNATVGGGIVNTNIFNSVLVGTTVPAAVTITGQDLGVVSTIEQGIDQTAQAWADDGNATATGINQGGINILNFAVGTTVGTTINVVQGAGAGNQTVEQDSENHVQVNSDAGEATIDGKQKVENYLNWAGSGGSLNVNQTINSANIEQNGDNTADASSDGPATVPTLADPDPAINMQQTVLNYVNLVTLTKTSGQAGLTGTQTYGVAGAPDMTATNDMDAQMDGNGNANVTGSQHAEFMINVVTIASGGAAVPALATFAQSTTGDLTMDNDGNNVNDAHADVSGDGNAAVTGLTQSVLAYVNVIDTAGPLSGDFSQTTGGATTQDFDNHVGASVSGSGTATVNVTQSVVNAINVIK